MTAVRESATTHGADRQFRWRLGAMVALGAIVRLTYVLTDSRPLIGGDGLDYSISALRIADGLGYTSIYDGSPIAQHPPGWVTFLGAASWLGARSQRDHQLVTVAVGLVVIALAGLVGRRYFNTRVGLIAAFIAAVYPGFWVLEGNVLSEPLGLVLLGCFMLQIADLRDHPTLIRSVFLGVTAGLLALTRSEELALLVIVVLPILLLARAVPMRRRVGCLVAVFLASGACILPWTIYNSTRFKDPVLLLVSTNDGGLLMIGNCPPATYTGNLIGYFDVRCTFAVARQHPHLDRSQLDGINRDRAIQNMINNHNRLLVVVPARFGRLLAVYHPSQTVQLVATWMTTGTALIWSWVASFWFILALAVLGAIRARRRRELLLPLLGPVLVVIVTVAIGYGEPRYHTPADLGLIVLAAAAIDALLARHARRQSVEEQPAPSPALSLSQ